MKSPLPTEPSCWPIVCFLDEWHCGWDKIDSQCRASSCSFLDVRVLFGSEAFSIFCGTTLVAVVLKTAFVMEGSL